MNDEQYEIRYTVTFKKEVEKVFKYIVRKLKNKIAAEKLLRTINKMIIERSYSPKEYPSFKLRDRGKYRWYKININNYSAFYTIENNTMILRRFIYSKRNFEKLF